MDGAPLARLSGVPEIGLAPDQRDGAANAGFAGRVSLRRRVQDLSPPAITLLGAPGLRPTRS